MCALQSQRFSSLAPDCLEMADRYFPNPFSLPLDVDKAEIRLTMRSSVLAGLKVRSALARASTSRARFAPELCPRSIRKPRARTAVGLSSGAELSSAPRVKL